MTTLVPVVTIATDEAGGYLPFLRASCERYGGDLTVLKTSTFDGYNSRTKHLLRHLRNQRNQRNHWNLQQADAPSDDPFTVICDGYDVLVLRDLASLQRDCEGADIVVGVDVKTSALDILSHIALFSDGGRVDLSGNRVAYLNAGVYFGSRSKLISLLERILEHCSDDRADDQFLMSRHMASGQAPQLTTTSSLIHTVFRPLQNMPPPSPEAYFAHAPFQTYMSCVISNRFPSAHGQLEEIERWLQGRFFSKCVALLGGLGHCRFLNDIPVDTHPTQAFRAVVFPGRCLTMSHYVMALSDRLAGDVQHALQRTVYVAFSGGVVAAVAHGAKNVGALRSYCDAISSLGWVSLEALERALMRSITPEVYSAFATGAPTFLFYSGLCGLGDAVIATNRAGAELCRSMRIRCRLIENLSELIEVMLTSMSLAPLLWSENVQRTLNVDSGLSDRGRRAVLAFATAFEEALIVDPVGVRCLMKAPSKPHLVRPFYSLLADVLRDAGTVRSLVPSDESLRQALKNPFVDSRTIWRAAATAETYTLHRARRGETSG
jgi:hypothetical protein